MTTKQRSKGTGTLVRKVAGSPFVARYFDFAGKRRDRSTHTTDHATAQRILAKFISDTALRRDGVINPRDDRYALEGRKPLGEQIDAYLKHCERAGQVAQSLAEKGQQLRSMIVGGKAARLCDLTADALELHLSHRQRDGLSARTVNRTRAMAVAFVSWCVKSGRMEMNPLRIVPKQDELRDRRRVRRALTDSELSRLLEVARERGREAWYLAAAFAGLRRGDMMRLTWSAINFNDATITISDGKAKRCDVLPMHPQLADALKRHQQAHPALPTARVWSEAVTNLTRIKDFKRAGIALVDSEGRFADLHGLRATLATNLARASVTPQVAQRILRHSDYRTTLKHYTLLGLTDTAAAIARIPTITPTDCESLRATGTLGREASSRGSSISPTVGVRNGAIQRDSVRSTIVNHASDTPRKNPANAGLSVQISGDSTKRAKGFEPSTFGMEGRRSTTELRPQGKQ